MLRSVVINKRLDFGDTGFKKPLHVSIHCRVTRNCMRLSFDCGVLRVAWRTNCNILHNTTSLQTGSFFEIRCSHCEDCYCCALVTQLCRLSSKNITPIGRVSKTKTLTPDPILLDETRTSVAIRNISTIRRKMVYC